MDAYDRWVRVNREYVQYYDLVINRIKIVNQILGARYDLAPENPCVLKRRYGWSEVYYCKSCISSFEVWDVDGVRLAFERLDTLADTLWRYSCIVQRLSAIESVDLCSLMARKSLTMIPNIRDIGL